MQKAEKVLGREELPFIRSFVRSFFVVVVVVEPCQCRWKSKSDEEAKKKQIKGLAGRWDTYSLFQTPPPAEVKPCK
jgi:hypothetical protein